jgi:predicted transcriptional regulator
MQAILTSLLRPALAHSLATLLLSASITYGAGYALGCAVHRLNALLSAEFVSILAADAQRQATIEAWEAEEAAGRWVEPWPEEIGWGSWWDLEDRSEEFEAGLGLEPPLRWAV